MHTLAIIPRPLSWTFAAKTYPKEIVFTLILFLNLNTIPTNITLYLDPKLSPINARAKSEAFISTPKLQL